MTEGQKSDPHNAPSTNQIWGAEMVNLVLLALPLYYLSASFMDIAAGILGQPVQWPQVAFMSGYPADVRNGYLLFVLATVTLTFLSSGVLAAIMGASPGKALFGIQYVSVRDGTRNPRQILYRGGLLTLLLLPVLLTGPLLGFVFGPAADGFSLIALGLSSALFVALAIHTTESGTWVNRRAGVRPATRA